MMLFGRLGIRDIWPAMVAVKKAQVIPRRVKRVAPAWMPDFG
jgi:hypothetical protein